MSRGRASTNQTFFAGELFCNLTPSGMLLRTLSTPQSGSIARTKWLTFLVMKTAALPCKKVPGIPRNSGVKFLTFLTFLHIGKSREKARKSQECPGPLAFQEFLEKPGEPRKKISSLSRLFLMCKKARSFWLEWLLAHPGSSLIPGFPGQPGKIKRKFPRFPGFSLCAKKPGASDWNDFWHILPFPWFRGFLESLEKPRENLPHGTLGSSLIAGLPRKPGKAKRRFSTLHSWLLLNCGDSWKAWKSQEKTLRLLLAGSTESNQFHGKPGKA